MEEYYERGSTLWSAVISGVPFVTSAKSEKCRAIAMLDNWRRERDFSLTETGALVSDMSYGSYYNWEQSLSLVGHCVLKIGVGNAHRRMMVANNSPHKVASSSRWARESHQTYIQWVSRELDPHHDHDVRQIRNPNATQKTLQAIAITELPKFAYNVFHLILLRSHCASSLHRDLVFLLDQVTKSKCRLASIF